MMPNKSTLVDNIDISLYSALLTHHGNSRDVDEELCKELAEMAVQALLSSLPELKLSYAILDIPDGVPIDIHRMYPLKMVTDDANAAMYYRQLLEMKK